MDARHSACEPSVNQNSFCIQILWIRSCFHHSLHQFVWDCQGEREGKTVTHCMNVFKENMTAISHKNKHKQTTLPKKNALSWIHRLAWRQGPETRSFIYSLLPVQLSLNVLSRISNPSTSHTSTLLCLLLIQCLQVCVGSSTYVCACLEHAAACVCLCMWVCVCVRLLLMVYFYCI